MAQKLGIRSGRLARLVERLVYIEDAGSLSLSSPTITPTCLQLYRPATFGLRSYANLYSALRQCFAKQELDLAVNAAKICCGQPLDGTNQRWIEPESKRLFCWLGHHGTYW
jgi:hypothetical protein